MKLKRKLILDGIMFPLVFLVMGYKLTGNLVHELVGIALILLFMIHVAINCKYYIVMFRQLGKVSFKHQVSYIINIILLLAAVAMAVSSVILSRDVFAVLQIATGNWFFWRAVHIISAITILVGVFLHVVLHLPMLLSQANRVITSPRGQSLCKHGSRILAVILALVVLKMSFHNVMVLTKEGKGSFDTEGYPALEEGHGPFGGEKPEFPDDNEFFDKREAFNEDQFLEKRPGKGWSEKKPRPFLEEGEPKPPREEEADRGNPEEDRKETQQPSISGSNGDGTPTWDEYLSGLYCSGCGKRCTLLAPRCGKSSRYIEQARTEYQSLYGEAADD